MRWSAIAAAVTSCFTVGCARDVPVSVVGAAPSDGHANALPDAAIVGVPISCPPDDSWQDCEEITLGPGAHRQFPLPADASKYLVESDGVVRDGSGFLRLDSGATDGFVRYTFEGCYRAALFWNEMSWDTDVPAGTAVTLRARARNWISGVFAWTAWGSVGPVSPYDLERLHWDPCVDQQFQVELHFGADNAGLTPTVRGFGVTFHCSLIIC